MFKAHTVSYWLAKSADAEAKFLFDPLDVLQERRKPEDGGGSGVPTSCSILEVNLPKILTRRLQNGQVQLGEHTIFHCFIMLPLL